MKILITGAAGQIGSGLAKRICDKHELTLVDNLRNGYAEHLKDDANEFIAPFYDIDVGTADLLVIVALSLIVMMLSFILLLYHLYLIVKLIH